MNCGCCCIKTLSFCKQNICGAGVDFDIKAQVAGTHKLVTYFLNIQHVIEQHFEDDEQIIFPINDLNENFEYTVEIFDPNGAKVVIRKNEIDYDCFKFQTIISQTLVAAEAES